MIGTTFFLSNSGWRPLTDMDPAFCIEDWLACVHVDCEISSCKYEIKLRHDFVVGADGVDIFCNIGA